MQLGDYVGVAADCSEALKFDASCKIALEMRAASYQQQKKFASAAEDFANLARLFPSKDEFDVQARKCRSLAAPTRSCKPVVVRAASLLADKKYRQVVAELDKIEKSERQGASRHPEVSKLRNQARNLEQKHCSRRGIAAFQEKRYRDAIGFATSVIEGEWRTSRGSIADYARDLRADRSTTSESFGRP